MSLDCFPFGDRRIIDLHEQPIALDVAYDENLLITVVDNCQTIIIFDLEKSQDNVIGQFKLGHDIVIDKVIYSKAGDYIAALGHSNGRVGLYAVLNWRKVYSDNSKQANLIVEELNLKELAEPFDEIDRSERLTSIDACQRTGNLAASYGDLIVIYQLNYQQSQEQFDDDRRSHEASDRICSSESIAKDLSDDFDELALDRHHHFEHLISVKLAMWATRISLCENYLSIMAIDHVQVLKLEVLTLQIQSDGLDGDGSLLLAGQQQVNRSAGSSGESHHQAAGMMIAGRQRTGANASNAANETTVSGGASASGDESSGSIVSGMTSNQSTRTNFSSFMATDNEELLSERGSGAASSSSLAPSSKKGDYLNNDRLEQHLNNAATDSDMTVITMNNSKIADSSQRQQLMEQQYQQHQRAQLQLESTFNSQDDCITWNLNTKKLVKLPTLMHNTSTELSSFHICHPLELLGPASESIACRVGARIYSADLSQNQLEPVVLLCKQFDFDRDPIKLVQLEPVYLACHLDDQKRLSRGSAISLSTADSNTVAPSSGEALLSESQVETACVCPQQHTLLKSADHNSLAAVSCFVSTLTSCLIYSLTGKKVSRLQTITHPGLCLDLRADLLNVYLLTPLGLQVCSTSICDAAFRHEWSSSADLNLSFIACDRARVLATKNLLVLVSSSAATRDNERASQSSELSSSTNAGSSTLSNQMSSFIEVLRKPLLGELQKRIVQTTQCCQSISIRSNLLTYLQTTAQLEVVDLEKQMRRADSGLQVSVLDEAVANLRTISLMLARQLLQKKQTNMLTNGRIDKTIKHLLDNSYCDLSELMRRHWDESDARGLQADEEVRTTSQQDVSMDQDQTLAEEDEEEADEEEDEPADGNFELLKIFLRYTKFNQAILEYLKSLIHRGDNLEANRQLPAFNQVVSYMFDYNPRLLIKCAQRIVRELPVEHLSFEGCLEFLVEQLKRLVKLNSTGINRATVLFTLAILYHEMAVATIEATQEVTVETTASRRQHLEEQCLASLSQIKPLNHLAITMCSNHEIISRSMALLVNEHYPQVFKLFLNQLQKREELLAARDFERLVHNPQPETVNRPSASVLELQVEKRPDTSEYDDDEELFEQKLHLLAEMSPVELAEFFCRELEAERTGREANEPSQNEKAHKASTRLHRDAIEAYLRASINLMESKFILSRLCENSR